jgi:hypothetical protein
MISGVYYQSEMPLGWQVGAPPSAAALAEWMHTDAVVLRALASVESQPVAYETEFGNDVEKKLDRVEAKLDLALNLLSNLLAQHTPKPETCPVTLSASTIEWVSHGAAPAKGSIVISLFINPRLPQPLLLPASVREIGAVAGGTRIVADFTHLSEEVQESLERTVFRNHRRYIQAMHSGNNRQG